MLAQLIDRIGQRCGLWRLAFALERLRFPSEPMLVVFTYHRVVDHDKGKVGFLGYDWGLDYRLFADHLDAIGRYFDVVDLPAFIDILDGKKTIERRTALITFDDADSDFADYALPALRRHNFPAVVFVPTAYVDTERRFWHLRITNVVTKLDTPALERMKADPGAVPDDVRTLIARASVATYEERRALGRALCRLLDDQPQEMIDRAVAQLERHVDQTYAIGVGCMSWETMRSLQTSRIDFQSHTVNHRKLALLKADEIRDELIGSRQDLEKHLNATVTAICYPAGSFSEKVLDIAPSCGYSVGFTTQLGVPTYPLAGPARYALPRLTINGDNRPEVFSYVGKLALKRLIRGRVD
ncbi:MAG: polysaccharide deacetylase family protein [candidate division Zixibacteria bacterium]|nr:polysaccharide deacetylase family protein [candidate division Zixibacteria bacterium]